MCGRVIVDYEEMMSVAGDTWLADWISDGPTAEHSSWNIAPTQDIPIVFTDPHTGANRFAPAYWSLIPSWAKTLRLKFPTFNARAETVATKPTFKAAVKHSRCAIPVTGFYEWSGPKGARVQHVIQGPEPVLPIAGLYSWWRVPGSDPEAPYLLTATVLTTASIGRIASLHDRMPVFLHRDLVSDWLDASTVGDQHLVDATAQGAAPIAELLRIDPVM